jgi:hypothetical protein
MWLLNTSLVKVNMAWYRTAVEIEIRLKDARSGEEWVEKVKHFETIQNSLTSRFPVLLECNFSWR